MKIKTILLTVLCSTFVLPAFAQQRETLLSGEVTHGGFGGPEIRITELDGESNILMGGKGAWLVNHQFYLGGAGFGATKKLGDSNLDFGYGGVMLGYIFPSHKKFTFSTELIAGVGGISRNDSNNMHMGSNNDDDTVLIFEPAIFMQLNLTQFANINAGISYRLVTDSDDSQVSNSDLSGLSANINIMFGSF